MMHLGLVLVVVCVLSTLPCRVSSQGKLVFRPLMHPPRIYQGAPPGVHVTTVHAYDPDNPRKKVIYNLPSVLDFEYFVLDQASGNLTTAKTIEKNVGEIYQVMAAAVSSGLSELEHLQIVVTDFNQFAPRFEKPAYRAELLLHSEVGSPVLQVHAVDPDPVPINAEIYYRMDQNESTNYFSLDPMSGALILARPLNISKNVLMFGVFAEDGGSPKRWAQVQVEITVRSITMPEDVHISNVTVSSAVICWRSPRFGFVDEYLIDYKAVTSMEHNSLNVTSYDRPEMCATLTNLRDGQKYEFQVTGSNSIETGQGTPPQYFETIPSPCIENICNSADCQTIDTAPWYRCNCGFGHYGSHCEFFDACSQGPCRNGGTCLNITHNQYVCICAEDYTGINCDVYNPCMRENSVCKNSGTCEMTSDDSYRCICTIGYHGPHCQYKDPCFLRPCENGGTCNIVGNQTFTCTCPDGFLGSRCDTRNPCFVNPCNNNGICEMTNDYKFKCLCHEGFHGELCQHRHPCFINPCFNSGTCESIDDSSYSCICPDGYFGQLCERKVPCFTKPCYNGGSCNALHDTCSCADGYYGEQCEFADPCSQKPCKNGGLCIITGQGTYSCSCPEGFYGDTCERRNLCVTKPCQNGGSCIASDAFRYTCMCANGFTGSKCANKDPCFAKPCANGGECERLDDERFLCICPEAFYGDLCESRNQCFTKPCYNGGTCINVGVQDFSCSCPPDYYGPLCENKDPCLADPCHNGATCEMQDDDSFSCICAEGYHGPFCQNKDPCSAKPCLNGGACERTAHNSYMCVCQEGYYGALCQNKDPCFGDPCQNGGTCEMTSGSSYLCICPEGYHGDFCQIMDVCTTKPCRNGGTCRNTSDVDYKCLCPPGYTGKTCEKDIDECSSNPCHINAVCLNTKGNFTCICAPGYKGITCSIPEQCPDDVTDSEYGEFHWNKTDHSSTALALCPHSETDTADLITFAKRNCELSENNTARWGLVDATNCQKKVAVFVEEVAEDLHDLTQDLDELTEEKLVTAAKTLNSIIPAAAQDKKLVQKVADVFSQVLDVEANIIEQDENGTLRESLLQMVDDLASHVPLKIGETLSVDTENIGIRAASWHPDTVANDTHEEQDGDGLKFEIRAMPELIPPGATVTTSKPFNAQKDEDKNEYGGQSPVPEKVPVMQVFVPQMALETAHHQLNKKAVRVNVMVYYNDRLFQPKKNVTPIESEHKNDVSDKISEKFDSTSKVPVLKINVGNVSMSNMQQPLVYIIPLVSRKKATCVFWKDKDSAWSTDGLHTNQTEKVVICASTHLTAFSVLLDPTPEVTISAEHKEVLSLISYVGCALSILGLSLTILTYSLFRCLNKDHSGKILLNLCLSLLLLNLIFLMGATESGNRRILCALVAFLLHFFLLTSLSWMCVEAVNMYQLLVHVFASSETHFLLKRCLLAWGGPFVIVGVTVATSFEKYLDNGPICMLTPKHPWVYYSAFLTPCCIILAVNVTVFVLVSRVLFGPRLASQSSYSGSHVVTAAQVRGAFTVLILLGVTWIFGTFAVGDVKLVFQYIFCITNSLQGFLIFLVRCLLYPEARGAWIQLIKYGKLKKYRGVVPTGAVSWSTNSQSAGKQNGKTTTSTVRKYSNEGMGTVVFNSNFWNRPESRRKHNQNGLPVHTSNSKAQKEIKQNSVSHQHHRKLNNSVADRNKADNHGIYVTSRKGNKTTQDFSVLWKKGSNFQKHQNENEEKNEARNKVQNRTLCEEKNNNHNVQRSKEQRSFSVDIFCPEKNISGSLPSTQSQDSLKGYSVLCRKPLDEDCKSSKEQRSASFDDCISKNTFQTNGSLAEVSVRHPQKPFYRSSLKFRKKTLPVIGKDEFHSDDSESTDIDECPLESPQSLKQNSVDFQQNSRNNSRESIRI